MKTITKETTKLKEILKGASFFFLGFTFALVLVVLTNVCRNWEAIRMAMIHPEIVSSLEVAEPTFEIKK